MRISDWSSDVCSSDLVLQFLAFPDIRVPDDRRTALYEAIGLVNEQLWICHFELWSSSGILLYRHAALIDGAEEGTLSLAAAELLIESAIDECERFYPVFQFVLWGGKTPREAIAAALIETQGEARSEEHTSELQSLMRNSYAVFCLKKKKTRQKHY